jgi:F-type H+-transporting ATPase subunit b
MYFLGLAEGSVQLVPDGTIFIHIALVLLMIFILNRTLYKPINKILADREKKTGLDSSEAASILQSIDEKMSHYENSLREARGEGYRLMEQTRSEAMSLRETKLGSVREEVSSLIKEEKDAIQRQSEEARVNLEKEARTLAAKISSQILHRPINS